ESPKVFQEIKLLVNEVTANPYTVPSTNLQNALIQAATSPAHPHTDVEAFYNILYISSSLGVHDAHFSSRLEGSFGIITDIPAFRVACSYGSMAVAAVSEGMFEQLLTPVSHWPERTEPVQLSSRPCTACSWASFDVIGTSGPRSAGYIAAFT